MKILIHQSLSALFLNKIKDSNSFFSHAHLSDNFKFVSEQPTFSGEAFLYLSHCDPCLITNRNSQTLPYTVTFLDETEDTESYQDLFSLPLLDISPYPKTPKFLELKIEHYLKQIRFRRSGEIVQLVKSLVEQKLTQTEQQFLKCLLEQGTEGANRELLVKTVWDKIKVETKTIDTHLFNLRRKLETIGIEIIFQPPNKTWTLSSDNPMIVLPK